MTKKLINHSRKTVVASRTTIAVRQFIQNHPLEPFQLSIVQSFAKTKRKSIKLRTILSELPTPPSHHQYHNHKKIKSIIIQEFLSKLSTPPYHKYQNHISHRCHHHHTITVPSSQPSPPKSTPHHYHYPHHQIQVQYASTKKYLTFTVLKNWIQTHLYRRWQILHRR